MNTSFQLATSQNSASELQKRYINLLKYCVSHWLWITDAQKIKRIDGRDWPKEFQGETMIGLKRLENIAECLATILTENIPGDVIEAGVWRGGAVIFMKGILSAFNVSNRKVWVADSFQGVPRPNIEVYPQDLEDKLYTYKELQVSKEEVKNNFIKYDLFDDNVIFLEGWFKDTLYTAPIEKLSLLRIDGDLYESTFQSLEALYPKLAPGGFCIVDDYGTFDYCSKAVDDYRLSMNINEKINDIDGWGIFWRKNFEG